MRRVESIGSLLALLLALGGAGLGCSPAVGSEAWCQEMRKTPKGDWSANQARDYAKHCLFE